MGTGSAPPHPRPVLTGASFIPARFKLASLHQSFSKWLQPSDVDLKGRGAWNRGPISPGPSEELSLASVSFAPGAGSSPVALLPCILGSVWGSFSLLAHSSAQWPGFLGARRRAWPAVVGLGPPDGLCPGRAADRSAHAPSCFSFSEPWPPLPLGLGYKWWWCLLPRAPPRRC